MLYTKIKYEIKTAMKEKNVVKRDVLKMVIDKARAIEKEQNPNKLSEDVSDDIMMKAIQKELKQLRQTQDALKDKEESNLYKETELEITILSEYLPKQMNKEEVEKAVAVILSTENFPNFGAKMKAVISQLKGKADNKLIIEVVENFK